MEPSNHIILSLSIQTLVSQNSKKKILFLKPKICEICEGQVFRLNVKGEREGNEQCLTCSHDLEDTRVDLLPDVIGGPAEQCAVVQLRDRRVVHHRLCPLHHIPVR